MKETETIIQILDNHSKQLEAAHKLISLLQQRLEKFGRLVLTLSKRQIALDTYLIDKGIIDDKEIEKIMAQVEEDLKDD